MSATYYGSYPVKKKIGSYADQNGIQFSSMQIVAKQSDAASYLPSIGSVYEYDSNLAVTRAEMTEAQNGLTEINVTAAGPSINAKPIVRINPGAPLIYGLTKENKQSTSWENAGTANPFAAISRKNPIPTENPTAGVEIVVTFVAQDTQRASVIETYNRKIMPTSINGVALPTPAQIPINFTEYQNNNLTGLPWQGQLTGFGLVPSLQPIPDYSVFYYGFKCVNMRIESTGAALLIALNYQESGQYLTYNQTTNNYETKWSYNL
jgi:hypothetical protein